MTLLAFAWLACSGGSATPTNPAAQPSPSPLQLFRVVAGQQTLTVQMMPDDRVLDGAGVVVGSYDAKSRTVTAGGVTIALDDVVRLQANSHLELHLPTGVWLIEVATGGEVTINGEHWGRLEGFNATSHAWRRLEALLAALPVLPTAPTSHRQSP